MKNKTMGTIIIIAILVVIITACVGTKQFGSTPKKQRLEHIQQQDNYKGGQFTNIEPTSTLAPEAKSRSVFWDMMFGRHKRATPKDSIPSVRHRLIDVDPSLDILVWLGHSSIYMQLDGKRFMIDPVLSSHASPVPFMVRAYKGSTPYGAEDFPAIDYLLITHDHWDHLDYRTVKKLNIGKVICPLGVGQHFERWGFAPDKIVEGNWGDSLALGAGLNVYVASSRHFSGRGIKRNKALWASYVLQSPSMRIYISGDGGYDGRFAQLGAQFGGFDLAILENGQYNTHWRMIHMLPDETIQAAVDLNASKVLPTHHSKFTLALHPWDEPLDSITRLAAQKGIPLLTPKIGDVVYLKDKETRAERWWEGVE